jgi:hypothetical protein
MRIYNILHPTHRIILSSIPRFLYSSWFKIVSSELCIQTLAIYFIPSNTHKSHQCTEVKRWAMHFLGWTNVYDGNIFFVKIYLSTSCACLSGAGVLNVLDVFTRKKLSCSTSLLLIRLSAISRWWVNCYAGSPSAAGRSREQINLDGPWFG